MNKSARLISIFNDTDSDKDDKINNLFDFAANAVGLECKIDPKDLVKEGRKISRRNKHGWKISYNEKTNKIVFKYKVSAGYAGDWTNEEHMSPLVFYIKIITLNK